MQAAAGADMFGPRRRPRLRPSSVHHGRSFNGHAKRSCIRQIDYAATETCAINLSAEGLPWRMKRNAGKSRMQVKRASIISLVQPLGGGVQGRRE